MGGASTIKSNTRPIKSPRAPSIPNAKIPNISPMPISSEDKLTTRSGGAVGTKTAALKLHD